jgi:hypothetical protein
MSYIIMAEMSIISICGGGGARRRIQRNYASTHTSRKNITESGSINIKQVAAYPFRTPQICFETLT